MRNYDTVIQNLANKFSIPHFFQHGSWPETLGIKVHDVQLSHFLQLVRTDFRY